VRASGHTFESLFDCGFDSIALAQVALNQIWNHAAGRKFARGAGRQAAPIVRHSPDQHAVGGDLTRQLGFRRIVARSHKNSGQ